MSVLHSTFTLERIYPVKPDRVFAAWAEPAAKARWFAGPQTGHRLDFRVGGHELATRESRDGTPALTFDSVYHEIVPDERIVFASTMIADGTLTTVSLTSVELTDEGQHGTRLTLTEQGTYLDGHEHPEWREQGSADQLDALGAQLAEA